MKTKLTSAELYESLTAPGSANGEAEELKRLFAVASEDSMLVATRQYALAKKNADTPATSKVFRPMAWSVALVAVAISLGVPLGVHHHRQVLSEEARRHNEEIRVQQEQQKTDEALLMNVQSDLSSTVPQSLQAISVQYSSSTSNTKGNNE